MADAKIEILHKEDGEWLSFSSPTGKSALINLDTFRGPIVRAAIIETVAAALAARDTLAGQLCRAREACNTWVPGWGTEDIKMAVEAALSSSAPCPHEAEAKRLRRELSVAVASAKAMVSNEMVARLEIIYKEEIVGCSEHEVAIMTRFMEDFRSLARENREALDDILRRRADAGRQEGHDATP